MNMKIEVWNGCKIRFVEKEPGEWWAVANDVAYALEYSNPWDAIANHCPDLAKSEPLETPGGKQKFNIISEIDIYSLIFGAASQGKSEAVRRKAEEFKRWVFGVIKTLRQASGLEGFQIFRLLDIEHQKEAMSRLNSGLAKPTKKHFIKANTIADKAVSSMFGYPKMLKKDDMSPDMLVKREPILEDTTNLMVMKERFGLVFSISDSIYKKYLA